MMWCLVEHRDKLLYNAARFIVVLELKFHMLKHSSLDLDE
jgi:hypothetical protein